MNARHPIRMNTSHPPRLARVAPALLAVLYACTNGPSVEPAQQPAPARDVAALAKFERFVGGEWRLGLVSGSGMFDRWSWGPGERSVRNLVSGRGGADEPWRALLVVYWHPAHEQLRLLRVSTFARGVSEGALTFDGRTLEAAFDLYQEGGVRRDMRTRGVFEADALYREVLLESSGPGADYAPLVELVYARSETITPIHPRLDDPLPRPSAELRPLAALAGKSFAARVERADADALDLRTTCEWVPFADYVHARTVAVHEDGEPTLFFDAYVYYHPGADALRCLALSEWGSVHEGDVTVLANGSVELQLRSFTTDGVRAHAVRLDIEESGAVRDRVWTIEGAKRALQLDVLHEPRD